MKSVCTIVVMFTLGVGVSSGAEVNPAGLGVTSATIQALVHTVGRSVVQVVVSGYRPEQDSGPGIVVARARSIGSGVVVADGGYVVTNAHVVSGAERIDLVIPDVDQQPASRASIAGKTIRAHLIGLAPELDLALLKADVNLPPVPFAGEGSVHQGELVFAFGSPDGLRNSVSMGIVSAVARQVDPSNAVGYIQTDSAINPGNSGGPLVNTSGELVGLNTFIQTRSGGSEGLGFALPVSVLRLAYPQLRDFGHIHRGFLGMSLLAITPALREGLQLDDESGLLVADVAPRGPAAAAGLQSGDVIRALDGHPIEALSFEQLYRYWYALPVDARVSVTVWRDGENRELSMQAVLAPHDCERPSTLDHLDDEIVESLALFGETLEQEHGVLVTARIAGPTVGDVDLQSGDVIRAVNRAPVDSVEALRNALSRVERGHSAVLQIERGGALTYVEFQR